ncbi:tetratricopeptide repeat protein [Algoriphagus chordae]|uniref:TPR repeat protein n=1 Tax=Algoriphagus chordae TaxID=237019 RepID=A0A2W7R170_9BACT|nr:tetratricopeptide repeat protein [Algoriphagus chordae]PZX49667.1 TPR repeat protein [Algoriphagus chordae]
MSFEKGIELYKSGKFEEALAIFDELVKANPDQPQLHLNRGRILSRLGRTEEALVEFDLITSLEPYNTDFISDRAVVLHLLNRNEEALTELDRAANLDPKNPYRYSSRAYFKDRIGDLEGAIADYETAIALDPEDAVSHNNKGLVEEKLGYQAKSKKSFEKADDLVGNKPKDTSTPSPKSAKEDSNFPEIDPKSKAKPAIPSQKKEMTFNHFLNTLGSVFNNSHTRKEFGNYLKGFFGGKKNE